MQVNEPNLSPNSPAGSVTGSGKLRQAQEAQQIQQSRSSSTPSSGGISGGDDVQLSDLARSLQGLKAALEVDPPEQAARVEQLAQTYAAGNYNINAEAIVGGLVAGALSGAF